MCDYSVEVSAGYAVVSFSFSWGQSTTAVSNDCFSTCFRCQQIPYTARVHLNLFTQYTIALASIERMRGGVFRCMLRMGMLLDT